ncbi:MAG: Asd/ArgC dimerization domain-containing protein, partial [Eubacteriales bacterium]|nr:Asd/ArgC dimerization domain-containing protein [Eubacteriales bacterium]
IELNKKPNLKIIKELLSNMQGVELIDDIHNNKYPMPLNANGQENVFVGRIRKDTSCEYAINMFISFDNILKGAALNAVQILEKLIKK